MTTCIFSGFNFLIFSAAVRIDSLSSKFNGIQTTLMLGFMRRMRNMTERTFVFWRPARIIIEGFDDEAMERAISAPIPSSLGPVMRTVWGV